MTDMRAISSQSDHVRRGVAGGLLLLVVPLWLAVACESSAQEIGRLYATKPPPGYAFVRVVVADDRTDVTQLRVGSSELPIDETATASPYRAVPGNQPLRLLVNGAASITEIVPRPHEYTTLVVRKSASGWTARPIGENQKSGEDLKAKLRFFNLVPDCVAALRIAGGPAIFDKVPFETVQARSINPVTATIEGSCGDTAASVALPQLRPGDHYSIFLRKISDRLLLTGQLDETEPYRER